MNRIASSACAAAFVVTASVGGAQQPPQQLPPVHPIGPVVSTSAEPLASVSQVRALPDGRVIVNDNTGRRVLMFDSTFKTFTVIADSTSATANAYGARLGGLIAYRGDSTLFVDPASLSMLVVDPNGKITRTMAAPRPNDVNSLIGGPFGTPGFDAKGRLVSRSVIRSNLGAPPAAGGAFQVPTLPDSSLIVRLDLATRKLDTIGTFGIPKINLNMTKNDNGNIMMTTTVNPMPWTDDWALLADGTVAIVRGRDYRVDLIGVDGRVTSAPKLAFDWQRMTDEDKLKVIDSTRDAMEKVRAAQIAQAQAANPSAKAADTASGGRQRPTPDGGGLVTIRIGGADGGAGALPPGFVLPPLNFVSVTEMPDYRPAFRQGAARGDADGNLWIRTSKMVNGGAVYDVINAKGELKDRVLLPPGRVIAGFGPGGTVYMGVVDGTITHLERAKSK